MFDALIGCETGRQKERESPPGSPTGRKGAHLEDLRAGDAVETDEEENARSGPEKNGRSAGEVAEDLGRRSLALPVRALGDHHARAGLRRRARDARRRHRRERGRGREDGNEREAGGLHDILNTEWVEEWGPSTVPQALRLGLRLARGFARSPRLVPTPRSSARGKFFAMAEMVVRGFRRARAPSG